MSTPLVWWSQGEDETESLGEALGKALLPRGVLLLEGEMGSGKTVLVRGLARALGVDAREVQSPTYALIHEHGGDEARLVHVDLYRLAPEEIETLGLDEQMASPGIVAIEWADRLEELWGPLTGPGILAAEILRDEDGRRQILLRGDLDRLPKTQTDLS